MAADYVQWVLTDIVHGDIWLDSFQATAHQLPEHHAVTPWKVTKRTLQGGVRHGVDHIELDNGALRLEILPTRGMNVWRGHYHGIRLGWDAPFHGPVHPSLVRPESRSGLGWLDGFDEWICRCGLGWNGPPGDDRGQRLTLHGRIANQPAHFVGIRVGLTPPYPIQIVGRLEEAAFFGQKLHLTTVLTTTPGSHRFTIQDVVENRSAQVAELQLLYHCNFGPPLLEAGSQVHVPAKLIAPRDARAAEFIAQHSTYADPSAGFAERVNYYQPLADVQGRSLALLHNAAGTQGCALRYGNKTLPWFIVWKNLDLPSEGYVTGLEPSTNFPNFKAIEREQGRVVQLAPGQHWEATVEFEVHDTPEGVHRLKEEIATLQGKTPPQVLAQPNPRWGGSE
jgi:hypothetical protein